MKKMLTLLSMTLGTLPALANPAQGRDTQSGLPATATYSQKALLKNWALSVCLAKVAKSAEARDDATATAGAYFEFGKQPIEAYQQLLDLADRYSQRKYSGSIPSEFNTMKCIDLLHSKELDTLTTRMARSAK